MKELDFLRAIRSELQDIKLLLIIIAGFQFFTVVAVLFYK